MHVLMKGTGRLSAGRAVKRLKRLGNGGEVALTGSFRGTASAVVMLHPSQVREWLESLDGPVLYLHDDAEVHTSQVEALERAHARSQALTAPETGPGETDASETPAVLGSSDDVANFLELVETPDHPPAAIERVSGISVDHDLSCRDADGRPLLVASMIVRDEADQIGACLASLNGLVDRIEIVDTGSVDDTVAIAKSHGASVTTAEWTNDFGAARNKALDRCRDARFVIHIDADERLVSRDIAVFRAALESTTARALRIPMRNVVNARVTSEFEAVRVFATYQTKWVGRVHEYPADADGMPLPSGRLDEIRIDHLGYDPEIVAAKDKWNRNVSLAEAAYLSEPSFKTRLDLARSLAWRSDDERAFELFREAASDLTGASPGAAAFVIAHVALSHQIGGELEQAHRLAQKALEHCSGEYVAHLTRARAWREVGDDEAIVDAHRQRSSEGMEAPMFDTAATRTMTDGLTVGALARLGHHVDALELAVAVLDADPARFDEWKSLATMPVAMRETGLPLLASMDPTGAFAQALVGEIPMGELAKLVLAHAQASERPVAHSIIIGIMAAVIAHDEQIATAIADAGAGALDEDQRSATAERCRLRGATAIANLLDPASV
jgi:hypothetical protein